MPNYQLTCCSTADMPRSFFTGRNIPYVCFHFTMDGKQYPDDLGVTMPFAEFYQREKDGAMPTTSQVNVDQYTEFFEPFLQAGQDILHLTLSSGISGTFNSATIAAQDLAEKYPERKIYIVDSLAASSGYGMLVDIAADHRDAGEDIDTLRDWLLEHRLNVNHWFYSGNLTHLMRGGRVSATAAFAGNLLHICPLMNVDHEGKLVVRTKVRGRKQVTQEMLKKMLSLAEGGIDYSGKCFICNSACEEDARALADLVEAAFPKLNGAVQITSIGTVIGSHTGPGTVALFFMGDKRTD